MAERVQLSEVQEGDVFEVLFPNTVTKSFLGMVTRTLTNHTRRGEEAAVELRCIELAKSDKRREGYAQVTQSSLELPQLRVGRHILRSRPEFRRWADDPAALMCFAGEGHPEVPAGMTLDELVRYGNGAFLLSDRPSEFEPNTAFYRNPFFDLTGRKTAVRQRVTVFMLDGDAELRQERISPVSEGFRPVLPDGATFHKVSEGSVLSGERGTLRLSTGARSTDFEHYALHLGYFAIETKVLERAGLASSAS